MSKRVSEHASERMSEDVCALCPELYVCMLVFVLCDTTTVFVVDP